MRTLLTFIIAFFSVFSLWAEEGPDRPTFPQMAFNGGPCGLKGSIEERIQNCNQVCSEEHIWHLVTRTYQGYEIWQNAKTKELWTDVLPFQVPFKDAESACQDLHGSLISDLLPYTWELPRKFDYISMAKDLNACFTRQPYQLLWVRDSFPQDPYATAFDSNIQDFVSVDSRISLPFRCIAH